MTAKWCVLIIAPKTYGIGNHLPEAGMSDSAYDVVIVGAGPGGLEAARIAAARGHEVHLYERDCSLQRRHARCRSFFDHLLMTAL